MAEAWTMPDLSPEAERLLRWLRHHRQYREGEAMLQAALDESRVGDQADFGRALLELARTGYVKFEVSRG
jgi:hypothetical protein